MPPGGSYSFRTISCPFAAGTHFRTFSSKMVANFRKLTVNVENIADSLRSPKMR